MMLLVLLLLEATGHRVFERHGPNTGKEWLYLLQSKDEDAMNRLLPSLRDRGSTSHVYLTR